MRFYGFLLVLILSINISAATKTWSGNGANNFFNNPDNWIGNVIPVDNDSLIFPANAAQFIVNNNLTAHDSVWNRRYTSITIEGGSYQFQGNRFNATDVFVMAGSHTDGAASSPVLCAKILHTSPGATLTFRNDNGLVIDGAGTNFITIHRGLGGGEAMTKRGTGKTSLYKGFSSYNGSITIEGGILDLTDFDISTNSVTVTTVSSGTFEGRLGGSQFIAQTSSAVVKPVHLFVVSLNFSGGAKFIPTVKCGSQVGGSVVRFISTATINGSLLEPVLETNCNPKVGNASILFIRASINPAMVTGNFVGLPEGSRILIGGIPFRLTYNGPNSVTQLVRIPTTNFDYDGDGKSDASVFRQSDSNWYLNQSSAGFSQTPFGISSDKLVPADYDGDGKTDIAVYRGGDWYQLLSSGGVNIFHFGIATDVPVPADYDGDNKADAAVFRDGTWYIQQSRDGFKVVQFGMVADKPVPGDFDGDNLADPGVFRDGVWHLQQSANGYSQFQFGLAADKPVVADYDGDGKVDPAVFRDGIWYLLQSRDGFLARQFGIAGDKPVAADYDGDGKADLAIFRNGEWYLLRSTSGWLQYYFGAASDIPVPNVYVPQ